MMQIAELHFRQQPIYDFAAIKARSETILDNELDCSDPSQAAKAFIIFHKRFPVTYTDRRIPAQTAILVTDQPPQLEAYRQEIQQSWRCPGADELLRDSQQSILVTEMMSRHLTPHDRVRLFHGVLHATVELAKPDALVFKHSQQVVSPSQYLDACKSDPIQRPGSLNVRFFNISNSNGDMIMDTRGLHELGLHDLQCHYRNLDPKEVGRVLFNTALYIFQNGPVIKAGETVQGTEPGSKWRCQFERSMPEPKRDVLDLDPGNSFAAGNRHRD
jgi:hypothetical protein